MSLNYLSVCSGIEAASAAWQPLGWKPVAFSEIEPFPRAYLKHHYPDVPNWGDMTKFKEWPDANVDVLVGGTPCQSFSVAGPISGLADPRGNLMLTYLAIAERYRPKWIVWENVPGILSNNAGRDFGTFLGGLGQLGYGFAFRVLDAQHVRTCRFPFAVPQRRRRVFVVGHLGDWRRAAAVLFDRESMSGHPAPRREAGKGLARGFECGPAGGGYTDIAPTLDTRCKDGPIRNQLGAGVITQAVSPTINAAFGSKLGLDNQHIDGGAGLFVSHSIAFTTEQTPKYNDECALTITKQSPTGGGQVQCVAERSTEHCFPINTQMALRGAETSNTAREGVGLGDDKDPGFTLQAAHHHAVATPYAVRRLTPTECERLMGFPDGATMIPYRNKPADKCADGPRYKALGNSMAVNVVEWIGERIAEVDAL